MTFFTVYSAYVQSLFFLDITFLFFHICPFTSFFPDIILLFFTLCPLTSFFQTLNTTLERQHCILIQFVSALCIAGIHPAEPQNVFSILYDKLLKFLLIHPFSFS